MINRVKALKTNPMCRKFSDALNEENLESNISP